MKNILVTGTSSGLGKAIAEHLHSKGFNVTGTSRNPKQTNNFNVLQLDITNDESVTNTISEFIKINGNIDVLINNAGMGIAGSVEETTINEAKAQFETLFFGTLRMIKAVLPLMRKKRNGLIINIGSIMGEIGLPYQAFYSAGKFALTGLNEALRMEVKQFNISVTNINPGDFKTSFTANRIFAKNLGDIYNPQMQKTLAIYERDEQSGSNPILVAKLVEKLILKEKGHKVSYLVGPFMQKLGVHIKGLLPSKWFEKIIMSTYK